MSNKEMCERWIRQAVIDSGVLAEEIPHEEAKSLFLSVVSKFGDREKINSAGFYWEALRNEKSIETSSGWKMLADMPYAGKPIFFHEDAIKIKSFGLRMPSMENLSRFVGELVGLSDLYFFSEDKSFLICINHHDFIICTGIARDWIARAHGS